MNMLLSQRSYFNLPSDIVYLNTAYMSPLLNSVVAAIDEGTRAKANPWKIKSSDFYDDVEKARELFSKIMKVRRDTVAIIPSASYGIETAVKNLSPLTNGDILILENQFPSNVYPWVRLARDQNRNIRKVPNENKVDLTTSILDCLDEKCDIVSLPNVLWSTGESIDLLKVRLKCNLINAALVLDLTQSAGAMAINLNDIKPDFAVVANYKWMLGPYSTGFLYVDPKHHNGQPLEEGWITRHDSQDFTNLVNYTDQYQSGATRFDVGERSNFSLIPGVVAALKQLSLWGIKEIESTLKYQNSNLENKLKNIGLKVLEEKYRGPHFLSAQLPKKSNPHLFTVLESKKIFVSKRSNSLRITPHLWNTPEEFNYFTDELSRNI